MRFLLSIALLLTLYVSASAQDTRKAITPTPSITITASRAADLRKAAEQTDNAQKVLERAQLVQRIQFLEAVLEALGIDLSKMEVRFNERGEITLTPKAEPPKTEEKK